jgi:flavodoxin
MNAMSIERVDLPSSSKKILIAYFSHSGNTRIIVEQIRNFTEGDIFEIRPVKDYPDDYQTVVDQAKKEINSNYKPSLKNDINDIGSYDVIFIGSPNWWSTFAPPVATFLSNNNLSGKTVVPFMTHEGTRMGHSVADIKKLCPDSTVLEGFTIRGGLVNKAHDDLVKWLLEMEMKK